MCISSFSHSRFLLGEGVRGKSSPQARSSKNLLWVYLARYRSTHIIRAANITLRVTQHGSRYSHTTTDLCSHRWDPGTLTDQKTRSSVVPVANCLVQSTRVPSGVRAVSCYARASRQSRAIRCLVHYNHNLTTRQPRLHLVDDGVVLIRVVGFVRKVPSGPNKPSTPFSPAQS